jgi:hypothetical protein
LLLHSIKPGKAGVLKEIKPILHQIKIGVTIHEKYRTVCIKTRMIVATKLAVASDIMFWVKRSTARVI